ncbi:hypothetical protein JKF63_07460 [Porcisia hertigi]|uniref:Uncharacterized protein n=1 Tax=Porcisia hertigi TaxID=2761500 RepID=A0A836IYZ4_9TRYP|nr:hypothetical protein JKF63_07460 [Porcisia hertigi]
MSSFSRSALEMLQAAEDSLTRRPCHSRGVPVGVGTYAYKSTIDTRENNFATSHSCKNQRSGVPSDVVGIEELQQQLSRAMRELIDLRAELAAERDRRHETLIAMGRQWKEDVLVEVHRREAALQSDVSSIEEKMVAQWRENNEGCLIMRRQLEEAMRASRVRDTDRFQLREELQERTQQMEERVDAALAQSSAVRADCSRQLEQERATLSQRLDAELLRLVEMRRDDQRALQQARELMRDEGLRMRDGIRKAVQEVWEGSAAALVKTATEPIEQLRAELRQAKANAQAIEERVADCVRTCQAECRVLTTTTREQLHALESKEAVATSSIDRAERKADSAYETAHHMEAVITAAKEATERALVQVAGAVERTLRIEHTITDRDSRLVAVESQLHAIATAEGLRAEVEACKRQAARLESRLEASGATCARVDQLADRTALQVAAFADRISSCEASTQRGVDAVQRVQEGLEALESEGQQARNRFDTIEAVHQRHSHLLAQVEQRVAGQENRLDLCRQQQEQYVKDHMMVQRELTDRMEMAHTVASRAEQVSSDVRGEVNRVERRLDGIDHGLASTTAEINTLRGAIDDQRIQTLELQRQQKQVAGDLRLLSSRANEQMASAQSHERYSVERVESQVQLLRQNVARCEERLNEMDGRVQDYLKNAMQHHVGEVQKRLLAARNESLSQVTERMVAVEGAVEQSQQRVAEVPQQLAAAQQASVKLQRRVDALEANLQSLRGQTEVLAVSVDTQGGDRQRLGTVQQELMRLTAVQGRTQQDVSSLQEALRGLQVLLAVGSVKDRSLSGLGMSQAQTASTDIAAATGANSSSPSAHQPSGSGVHISPHSLVTGTLPEQHQQRSPAVATPPLADTSKASLQEMQYRHRFSSGSSDRGSKEGSGERPALQLSGVSSVRPPDEQEGRLNSLVEPTEHSTASASSDDAVQPFSTRPVAVASPQFTSSETPSSGPTPHFPSTVTNKVEQLSALAVTLEHATAIREFTTIASSSSLSDDESSDDGEEKRRGGRKVFELRGSLSDEGAEDDSTDLTAIVTLTSEAPASQSSRQYSGLPPSPEQQPSVGLAGSRGHHTRGLFVEKTPVVRQGVWGNVSSLQSQRPSVSSEGKPKSVLQRSEAMYGDGDRVQAMLQHDSDTAEIEGTATVEDMCVNAVDLEPSSVSQVVATTVSMPHTRNSNWNDWDSNSEANHTEEGRERPGERDTMEPQSPSDLGARHPVNCSNASSADDVVMHVNSVEESSGTPGPRTASSIPFTAGVASVVVHHRDVEDDLTATPRRIFVSTPTRDRGVESVQQAAQMRDSVPRHGIGTTSSSSSSAERAEALGLRGVQQGLPQRPPAQMRQYTNFDDSTSAEDD